RAALREADPRAPDRSTRGRQLSAGPALLRLLRRTPDDIAALPPAVRQRASPTGVAARATAHGPRSVDPEGHGGRDAAHGAIRAPRQRQEGPLSRRWRRAQLRRQRRDPARGAIREDLDPT